MELAQPISLMNVNPCTEGGGTNMVHADEDGSIKPADSPNGIELGKDMIGLTANITEHNENSKHDESTKSFTPVMNTQLTNN